MSPVNNKPQYSKEFKREAVDLGLITNHLSYSKNGKK